jgi:sporulation protein YlmC with PRC-barrel domain
MKKLLIGVVLPMFVVTPLIASAQQTQTPTRDKAPTYDKAPSADKSKADTRAAFRNDQNLAESKHFVGMRVKNDQGKDIGEVDNLLIDPQSGKISHVVVGYGGLAGVGEKKVVVPWSDLKVASDGKKPMATIDQAKLDSAPRWERTASADRDRTSTPSASPTSSGSSSTGSTSTTK